MNFKEALIAHLSGEKVECNPVNCGWMPFVEYFDYSLRINDFCKEDFARAIKFRLAPRTITVNGVEVPAPESVAPKQGVFVYVSDPTSNNHHFCVKWVDCNEQCSAYLERGLVYLNKEDAIARAKAMLLHE